MLVSTWIMIIFDVDYFITIVFIFDLLGAHPSHVFYLFWESSLIFSPSLLSTDSPEKKQ